LHAFFAARLEAGLGLEDDPAFDTAHSVIGSLGQVNVKPVAAVAGAKKKAPAVATSVVVGGEEKKKYVKKAPYVIFTPSIWDSADNEQSSWSR
jgi:transcriptional activator SPT7